MTEIASYQAVSTQIQPSQSSTQPLCFIGSFCVSPETMDKTSAILGEVQKLATPILQSIAIPLKGLAFRHISGLWASVGGMAIASGLIHFAKNGAGGAYTMISVTLGGVITAAAYQQEEEDSSLLPYFLLGSVVLMSFWEIKNLNNELSALRKTKLEEAGKAETKRVTRTATERLHQKRAAQNLAESNRKVTLSETQPGLPLTEETQRIKKLHAARQRSPDFFAHKDSDKEEPPIDSKEGQGEQVERKSCCRRWCRK